MLYKVKAKYKDKELKKFFEKLTDGTIENQKPDGSAIVEAMKEAKITDPSANTIEWYEQCFCATPLKHEIETVYTHYIEDIETELIEVRSEEFEGESFFDKIKS